MEEKRFTTKEAAEELGIGAARVRQMVISGRLKAEKFGHLLVIMESDLDAVRARTNGRPKKEKNGLHETQSS